MTNLPQAKVDAAAIQDLTLQVRTPGAVCNLLSLFRDAKVETHEHALEQLLDVECDAVSLLRKVLPQESQEVSQSNSLLELAVHAHAHTHTHT